MIYTNDFYENPGKITDFTRKNRNFGAFRTRKSPKNITKSPKLRKNRYGKDPEKHHTEGQWRRAKDEGRTGFDAEMRRRRVAMTQSRRGAECGVDEYTLLINIGTWDAGCGMWDVNREP